MCCRNRKKYCIFVRDNAGKMTNSITCFTYCFTLEDLTLDNLLKDR